MAEQNLIHSIHPGSILRRGARLFFTGLSALLLTSSLLVTSLNASAQSPINPGAQNGLDGGRSDWTGLVPADGSRSLSPASPNSINIFPGATTTLVSRSADGTHTGNSNSYDKAMTEDGQTVIFDSYANNLTAGYDSVTKSQIYLHTGNPGSTIPITKAFGAPAQGGNADSGMPAISRDGKFAAWISYATDLVNGVTLTGTSQVYISNLSLQTTALVTQSDSGTPGDNTDTNFLKYFPVSNSTTKYPGYWYTPLALTSDGSTLVYQSKATNLTPDGGNGKFQIYSYNTASGKNTLISKTSSGHLADCDAEYPRISGDGRYIVFDSCATNLQTNVPANKYQIYRVDTTDHSMAVITMVYNEIDHTWHYGDGTSLYPEISKDGKVIAFRSLASNIDPVNLYLSANIPNIFMAVYDLITHTWQITLISHRGTHAADAESKFSAISSDGRYIAFSSNASRLIPNDSNENCGVAGNLRYCPDIYLYDRINLTVELVSLPATTSNGQQSNKDSYYPVISGDGRYIGFDSAAYNLLNDGTGIIMADGTTAYENIYIRDRGIAPPDAAKMSLDKTQLYFGNIGLDNTRQMTLLLTSAGTSELKISSDILTESNPAFAIVSDTCKGTTLPRFQTCAITISFHQSLTRGTWQDTLLIQSDDIRYSDGFEVPVLGGESGFILNYSPDPLKFGNAIVDGTNPMDRGITLTSTGKPDLIIYSVTIGQKSNLFKLKTETCSNQVIYKIGSGSTPTSCMITITFTQKWKYGTYTGSVIVNSNDTENPALEIPFTGGTGSAIMLPILRK